MSVRVTVTMAVEAEKLVSGYPVSVIGLLSYDCRASCAHAYTLFPNAFLAFLLMLVYTYTAWLQVRIRDFFTLASS